jgi:6-phosphogluconolactonase/glucosamine-6-phosphate isomerase/deaminase
MEPFVFEPSPWVPFRDRAACERVRRISRADIEKHPNPDFRIQVVPDLQFPFLAPSDQVARLIETRDRREPCVFIMGNPNPGYANLARLINRLRLDCSHLHVFNMDEWADQDGNTAPESYPQGFMHAMKKYFYANIDPALRPPEKQIVGPTTANIRDFGKMIAGFGGATACYSGSGWTGHIAFIDPDVPEFDAPLEEWKTMGPRIVTLNPFTIAQNSMHASFGFSGDMANVPPKAATIGPAEVLGAKYRQDHNALTVGGTFISWQRFMTRLIAHGPVTPQVPASILQTVPTNFYISETAAADIVPVWGKGY